MGTKKQILIAIISVVGVYILYKIVVRNGFLKPIEGFDPQDMGGRTFFGAGRPYGYSVFDSPAGLAPQQCYESDPLQVCLPGYTRTLNQVTLRDECCVNPTNYGFFWPDNIVAIL